LSKTSNLLKKSLYTYEIVEKSKTPNLFFLFLFINKMDIVSGIVIGYSSAFGAAIVVYCYTEIKNYILDKYY